MPGRGFCVALIGPDGAGKTTIGTSLADAFDVPVHYIYSGLSPAAHPLDWLRRFPGGGRLLRLSRMLLAGVRARTMGRRGDLVLLDRAPQEFRLGGQHRGLALQARLLGLRIIGPNPDLAVLLDAPGEVLFARKGEHTVEILEEMRRGYRDLLPEFPASAIVDVRAAPDAVRAEVVQTIRSHWDRARTEL